MSHANGLPASALGRAWATCRHARWPSPRAPKAAKRAASRAARAQCKAEACLQEARQAQQRSDFQHAAQKFEDAALVLQGAPGPSAVCGAWADCAVCRLELQAPFEALVACEHGLRGPAGPEHWRCGMVSALALETLGLLSIAEERLGSAARLAREDREGMQAALEGLRRVRARSAQLAAGEPQALMEEIQRMGALLGDEEAGYWISCVGERSRSAEGQAELVQKGFLEEAHQCPAKPAEVARRASLVALRYRVNKKLQRCLSAAGLLLGVADQCVLPKAIRHPGATDLAGEETLAELKSRRLAVVDGAFPAEAVAQVQKELHALRSSKLLQNDTNDVCNPLQEAKYLPFAGGAAAMEFREKCPITVQVMQKLAGLAAILEDELGLSLAVPQSAMAACYPPKASYKMHLDSYFLQGCPDDIPRKVTVLLYCNHGWSSAVGGELRVWEPFDQGRGCGRKIEPLAGRMVVFMSEEIWHEVLESHGDRYALTLWIHDRQRAM
ncbi:unnamed protein product [Effrenium voratum]|nr:unnamed protein product [Effrenium voratum]